MDQRKQLQRDVILAECTKRGIKVEQRERSYLLQGVGVHVLAADLADLDSKDLVPYTPRK